MNNTITQTVSATTTTDDKSATSAELRDIKAVSIPAPPEYQRGEYGEISFESLSKATQEEVRQLVDKAGSAGHIDEHGSWEFGVDYDHKRGECSSLNWDLYGIGFDCHTGQLLALIQVRQFYRKKAGYWPQIRKNYFLLGVNEDASVFAHSVSANFVHAAIRKGADVIKRVQDWIFEGDYSGMLRQGDIALMPCSRRPSAPKIPKRTMLLMDSHRLKGNVIRQDKTIYAKNPNLIHIPGTHPEVQGENRWYKIVIGKRADCWKFAAPTVD